MALVNTVEDEGDFKGGIKASKVREVDKKANAMREKAILPKFPASRIDELQWQEWARILSPEMWNRLALYVYRSFPVIIRQMSNPKNDNNIDIIGQQVVDIHKYLCELHGGGKYRIDVNDSGEKLGEIRVQIPIHEFEPKLDYRELDLFAKENQAYIQSLKYRGILDQDGKLKPPGAQTAQQAATTGMAETMALLDKFTQMQEKLGTRERDELKHRLEEAKESGLGEQIGAILLEKMKQDSPSTMVQGLTGVLSAAKEIIGPKEPPRDDSKMYEVFRTMLESQTKHSQQMMEAQTKHSEQMIALIKEMKTPNVSAEGGKTVLESLNVSMEIMERLSELGGGKGRTGWDIGLEFAKEVGVPFLQYATQAYAISRGLTGMGQPGQPPQPKTSGGTVRLSDQIAAEASASTRERPALAPKEGETVVQPTQQESGVPQQLVQQMGMAAGPILKQMADDRDGADFAMKLIDMYGKPAYAMIANYGDETILSAMQAIPPFWEQLQVYGEGKVKQFVHEFCHYEEFIQIDEEDVKEPEVVEPAKAGRKPRGGRQS